jgi:hypothetical protein
MKILTTLYDRPVFKRDSPARSKAEVIRWWETRRIFFNFIVGCTGILTCIMLLICAFISEPLVGKAIGLPDGPLLGLFGIFFYGILANIFYTCGWVAELHWRAIRNTENAAIISLRAFRAGVTFLVLLTLSPTVFGWLAFALAVLHGQKHGPAPE